MVDITPKTAPRRLIDDLNVANDAVGGNSIYDDGKEGISRAEMQALYDRYVQHPAENNKMTHAQFYQSVADYLEPSSENEAKISGAINGSSFSDLWNVFDIDKAGDSADVIKNGELKGDTSVTAGNVADRAYTDIKRADSADGFRDTPSVFDDGKEGIARTEAEALYHRYVKDVNGNPITGVNNLGVAGLADQFIKYLKPNETNLPKMQAARTATTFEEFWNAINVDGAKTPNEVSQKEAHAGAANPNEVIPRGADLAQADIDKIGDKPVAEVNMTLPDSLRGDCRPLIGRLLAQSTGAEVTQYDVDLVADYIATRVDVAGSPFKKSMNVADFWKAIVKDTKGIDVTNPTVTDLTESFGIILAKAQSMLK